jgi:hypothetical protein
MINSSIQTVMANYKDPKIREDKINGEEEYSQNGTYNNLFCYQAANTLMLLNSVELEPYD